MNSVLHSTYTAFVSDARIATGTLCEVAQAVWRANQASPNVNAVVICDGDGKSTDLDLRGNAHDVAERYRPTTSDPQPKGRGRPKLGVVAREVTLLPEHWEWLASQPGGASVALRKLVHEARRQSGDQDHRRHAQERAYHAMSTLAGDFIGFEEASRALFSGDLRQLAAHMVTWPPDVKAYVLRLAEASIDPLKS